MTGPEKEPFTMMYNMMPFGHNRGLANFFDDFDRHFFGDLTHTNLSAFRTDIRDTGNQFVLDADLPGFKREDIKLDLQGDILTITAQHQDKKDEKDDNGNYLCRERTSSSYSRSFNVSGIRGENITAVYQDGVLQLTLPKQETQVPQTRRIEIQ